MSTLDQERDLLVMADALGLGGRPAPVRAIVDYCRKRIAGWLPRGGALGSIEQLELLVCEKLYIVIEEIWSDADLEALIRRYVAMGEIAFANLVNEFDDGTFGTVYERKLANARSHDRYVAFIDCRGPQKSGAAVLYPLARNCPRAYKLQTTRTAAASSRVKSSPTEKMMDLIAGEIGFFDPLFRPLLEAELRRTCRLTFAGIERLRQQFCDSASFQSTVNACLSRVPFAGACVEAGLDCKKS